LNDVNPGVYWQFLCIAWGYYRNSHSTKEIALISRWVGFAFTLFGTTYSWGIVTGYPDYSILPYFSKSEVIRVGRKSFRLFFIPETALNSSAIHGAAEVRHTVSELWSELRACPKHTVKKKGSKRYFADEIPVEFRDSRVADLIDLSLIDRR
jgi:hypothetical protein